MLKIMGVSMIEALLAIVIIASIITASVKYYYHYQQHATLALVRHDVQTIYQALNDYFQQQGCYHSGQFVGKVHVNLIDQLVLPAFLQQKNPRDIIEKYTASIISMGSTDDNKPIYQLIVAATLQANIVLTQQQWYAKALNAETLEGDQLQWQSMPANRVSQGSDHYWPLNGFSRLAQQQFNEAGLMISPGYCVQ